MSHVPILSQNALRSETRILNALHETRLWSAHYFDHLVVSGTKISIVMDFVLFAGGEFPLLTHNAITEYSRGISPEFVHASLRS